MDSATQRILGVYWQKAQPARFLTGLFKLSERGIHRSEKVGQDILRDDRKLAIPVRNISSPGRRIELSKYTNKEYDPAIVKLETGLNIFEALGRQPGQTNFEDPNIAANIMQQMWRKIPALQTMIFDTVELMCAQTLQTGAISLVDETGAVFYSNDFAMKGTHKVELDTSWAEDGSTGTPLIDIGETADVVRADGQVSPNRLVFGRSALRRFLANKDVQAALQQGTGLMMGQLQLAQLAVGKPAPITPVQGGKRIGYVNIDGYPFEMWVYDGTYADPVTGALKPYLEENNVLIMSSDAPLTMTYGDIPRLFPPDARMLPFLTPDMQRMSNQELGVDLSINAWATQSGEDLTIQVGTRPLPIPTAIDSYACLTVVAEDDEE